MRLIRSAAPTGNTTKATPRATRRSFSSTTRPAFASSCVHQPDYGCSWKLAALCQNPPRSRRIMRARAQDAMRLGLALAGTAAPAAGRGRVRGVGCGRHAATALTCTVNLSPLPPVFLAFPLCRPPGPRIDGRYRRAGHRLRLAQAAFRRAVPARSPEKGPAPAPDARLFSRAIRPRSGGLPARRGNT